MQAIADLLDRGRDDVVLLTIDPARLAERVALFGDGALDALDFAVGEIEQLG